jgi:hypothetical protein
MNPRSPSGRLHDLAQRRQLAQLQAPNLDAARELHDDACAHAREHRITFEAAGYLLSGRPARTLSDAGYLRQQRNDNMYRQERADADAAQEAADLATRVAREVLPALKASL